MEHRVTLRHAPEFPESKAEKLRNKFRCRYVLALTWWMDVGEGLPSESNEWLAFFLPNEGGISNISNINPFIPKKHQIFSAILAS